MTSSVTSPVKAFALIALGLAIAAMGIYIADADDAPGGAVISFLLLCAAVWLGVRAAQNRLPIWAGRTAWRSAFSSPRSRPFSPTLSPQPRLSSRDRRTCRRLPRRRPRHNGRQQ